MHGNTKIFVIVFCCIAAAFLIGMGFLMRKYDFSCMFWHPFYADKKDGLYMRCGLKMKKVAEDTPENRKKFSKGLGNFFIIFSVIWLLIILKMIIEA